MTIKIPVVVILEEKEELLKVLLPTDALLELRSSSEDKILLVKEGEFHISMQKLIDYLITQKGFFEALDMSIDSEPRDRKINNLLLSAKKLPEN